MPASSSDVVSFYEPEPEGEAWSIPSLREPRYSQSLERGLAILSSFTPERPIRGIADVADELGMRRSTTHRYMSTLVALGYLEQGAARKYRLGLRVTDLGMSALNSTALREHARPYLEELCRQSSYTVSLAVLDGPEIVYVDRVRSSRRTQGGMDLDLAPGARLPAYSTAMGKLLMAFLPEEEQRTLLAEVKPTRMGPNTITSKTQLRAELEEHPRGGVRGERSGARGGAVCDRGAGSLGVPRGGGCCEHDGARLDDLAGGACGAPRPTPGGRRRSSLGALGVPTRGRAYGSALSGREGGPERGAPRVWGKRAARGCHAPKGEQSAVHAPRSGCVDGACLCVPLGSRCDEACVDGACVCPRR